MIYLCKPTGVVLGLLNGIDEESCSLTQSVSDPWELSFTLQRYIDGEETVYYSSTTEMMELLLDTGDEKIRFQIDNEPTISGDGVTESKEVTAHSIEIELQTKFLHNFKVNCGTKDSLEYLVGYYDEDDNFVQTNINPYTNLSIDKIVVQNDFVTALADVKAEIQVMDLQLEASTGRILNQDTWDYFYNLTNEYPRLLCDVRGDEVRIYLYVAAMTDPETEEEVITEVRICGDTPTKQYLLSGIDSLIEFYETYGKQLSLIDLAIENAQVSGWSVGDIPKNLRHLQRNFDIESQDILSFFKHNLSQTVKAITDFDRYNREVDLIDIAKDDNDFDTGVYLTFRNLLNSITVNSSSDDGIRTKYIPTGGNNLGILYANFGENYILNLDWFMNKINEYGEYQYVSEELRTKYYNWIDYRENTQVSYTINNEPYTFESRREAYIKLSEMYNKVMMDIDTFKYKVPNDGCNIDYTTFSFEELNIAFKAYMNALDACIELYRRDYGIVIFERASQYAEDVEGNVIEEMLEDGKTPNPKHIKNTMYWHDFCSYYYVIIPNVINALKMYVYTDNTGALDMNNPIQYDTEKGEWIQYPGGNPWYNGNSERVTESKADSFLYDTSLYGIVELEAKKKAWIEAAAAAYKPGFVLKNGRVVDPIPTEGYTLNTLDDAGWNLLLPEYNSGTDYQKDFTGKSDYIQKLEAYYDYMSPTERLNNKVHGLSVGLIPKFQQAINEQQDILDDMEAAKDRIQEIRKQIADEVYLDSWSEFTDKDLQIIHTLIREATYNNENILTTNITGLDKVVLKQKELLDDATIALSEKSQPQLSFEIDLDNLFAIEEFTPFRNDVKLLNFIRISTGLYDDYFVKLRVISIEKNPFIPTEELTLGFSNMTYSLQEPSDLAFMFNLDNGSGSGGSGSGGSGSGGGNIGANDAEINLANSMLNALLNQKTYAAVMGTTNGTFGTYDLGLTIADNILKILMGSEPFKEAIAMSVLKSILNNASDFKDLLTKSGLFDCFKVGTIVVSGQCITDYIKSSNYTGDTFLPSATEGSFLDLKRGRFNFGGGNITFDGTTLNICKGGIVYDGSNLTIQADTLKIGPRNVQDMIDDVKDKANTAIGAAATANSLANTAAKTATNYLYYNVDKGLIIHENIDDPEVGYNVQIKGDGINFREDTTIWGSIGSDGYKIYDGVGTAVSNELAYFGKDSDNKAVVYIGKTGGNDFFIKIDRTSMMMYGGPSKLLPLMDIYAYYDANQSKWVANANITGEYQINHIPVLTTEGFSTSFNATMANAFLIKNVIAAENWRIDAGDWEAKHTLLSSVLDSNTYANYTPLGIVGHKILNAASGGKRTKVRIFGIYLANSSNGRVIGIEARNGATNKSNVNVLVSLLLVKNTINLGPDNYEDNDIYDQDED